jgi:hypothetical protein
MSFLKSILSLFSGGGAAASAEAPAKEIEHNGFTIRATPYKEGGQYQLCGVIAKEVGGEMKEHRFIRAEKFPSLDDAIDMTFSKGKQIVEQSGERVFA